MRNRVWEKIFWLCDFVFFYFRHCRNIPCVLSFIPPESVSVFNQISVVWSVKDMDAWLQEPTRLQEGYQHTSQLVCSCTLSVITYFNFYPALFHATYVNLGLSAGNCNVTWIKFLTSCPVFLFFPLIVHHLKSLQSHYTTHSLASVFLSPWADFFFISPHGEF